MYHFRFKSGQAGRSVAVERVRVLVTGHVQGVGFRWSTERMARQEGLVGWVRNRRDGRVEAAFEGEADAVARAVEWCRHGPRGARVEDVAVTPEPPTGEREFRIEPTI
jgi:acylphosphatase